jgi:hypothetical protein
MVTLNVNRQIISNQKSKPSKMKSVKRHSFSGFSDDLFGGVIQESLNGHRFSFDSVSKTLFGSSIQPVY